MSETDIEKYVIFDTILIFTNNTFLIYNCNTPLVLLTAAI